MTAFGSFVTSYHLRPVFELVVLTANDVLFPLALGVAIGIASIAHAVFHNEAIFLSGRVRSLDVGWNERILVRPFALHVSFH